MSQPHQYIGEDLGHVVRETDDPVEVEVRDAAALEESEAIPEGPTVTRWEEWAYYLYYNGDCGVGPIGYAQTLFQSLVHQAGHDPATRGECGNHGCVIRWAGVTRSVESLILIANGISFAIMTVMFVNYHRLCSRLRHLNRWILIVATVICWAAQFGFVGVWQPSQWNAAVALFIIGFVSYGATLVFYAAQFPRLAGNTPKSKEARAQLDDGEITAHDYEKVEWLEKSRLSNISTAHSNWGYLLTMLLALALLLPSQTKNDPKVNNYVIALTNAYWILLVLPWFFIQKNRPGPKLPEGEHWLTVGWKQIFLAAKQYRRLPMTFVYLFSFFLLADGLNTTGTMVNIVQNEHIQFSFLEATYLGITQAGCSIFSCYAFWYIQRWWSLPNKRMFQVTNIFSCFIPFWGMLGLWTNKVGFHNTWEFYAYNAIFGLFQSPYYAYSQTLMSELTPPGFEGMFFGLFGITNRASSLIGPNVCSAIIETSGNSRQPFIFLLIICVLASLVITFFVDVPKGRAMAVTFAIEERGLHSEVRVEQMVPQDGAK